MPESKNMAKDDTFKRVASRSEIPEGAGKVVQADGRELAVFNVGGEFYALDNTCPHKGGPLGEGSLEGSVVTCPWHGWQFDVKTGTNTLNPQARNRTYPLKVEGEDILAELP